MNKNSTNQKSKLQYHNIHGIQSTKLRNISQNSPRRKNLPTLFTSLLQKNKNNTVLTNTSTTIDDMKKHTNPNKYENYTNLRKKYLSTKYIPPSTCQECKSGKTLNGTQYHKKMCTTPRTRSNNKNKENHH